MFHRILFVCSRLTLPPLLVVGCTLATHERQAGEEMSAALFEAERENDRHEIECTQASSMAPLMSELERHELAMDDLMTHMDESRDHMQSGTMMSMSCSGTSFNHMSEALTNMHGAMATHSDRMRSSASIAEARSECSAHTSAMREMTQGMRDDLHEMPCMGM